ncbi:MAG: ABC transporter ATP-binding protein [Fastidiosipilaceae bacterium]|jgi:ABC-type nitrate/sulfonate/bicarbonate transport system ATPase subunit
MNTSPLPSDKVVSDVILRAENIVQSFDGKRTLDDVSLWLREREIVSLLGVSGAGKTTLFNIIAGILNPDSGKVFFKNEEVTGESGHVAYMLQKDLLLKHMTVLDNVCLPLLIKGVPRHEAREQARPLFEKFGIAGYEQSYPAELSGGMSQRAAFLRTYLFSQEVALLDEPFSALDAITKDQMHRWYLDIMKDIQLSVILITHDIDEAIKLSDRIYILGSHGKIIKEIEMNSNLRRGSDFYLQPEFLTYKREIIQTLNASPVDE